MMDIINLKNCMLFRFLPIDTVRAGDRSRKWANFTLFALLEREELANGRWDIVVSALWVGESTNAYIGIRTVNIETLREHLKPQEEMLSHFSRRWYFQAGRTVC